MIRLLSNASATGADIDINRGGAYLWRASGTFGGATINLQTIGANGSSWETVSGVSFTAAGQYQVLIAAGTKVRAQVSGGSPSGLYADLGFLGVS